MCILLFSSIEIVNLPVENSISTLSFTSPFCFAAKAVAQAAVPHALVSPAPLSHTLTLISSLLITFAQILDRKNILVNVWERGAGLTKACGTAACATAVAGNKNKLVESKVAIKFKEGVLNIVLDEKNNIFMTGPVSEIKNIKVEI